MSDLNAGAGDDTDPLKPVLGHEKSWGWFAIFNIWANDIQSLAGYSLVASLFISYGVGGWTAFAALIVAALLVMFLVNLSGAAGERYGIPYPVLARASLGTSGAKLPAVLRAVVAVFWYGVQVYFASTALTLFLHALTGVGNGPVILGMPLLGWVSFLIVWALHIFIFWRGMAWVETFLNIAGPFVYAVMIGLLIVLWVKSDGQLWGAAQTIFANPDATFGTEFKGFVAIVGTMVAYFAAVMINFSDFSRFAKDRRAMVLGNLAGLPFNMVLFSALALLTTAGAAVVYGEAIINPTAIVERTDSVVLSLIAAVTFFAATVGINLVANFIPAVNGIANLAPKKISFRTAGMITSVFALVIGGFWTSFISSFGIAGFVNTLGAMLAPIYGIMIADYYVLRKQKLFRDELYEASGSRYHYGNGWNDAALISFAVAAVFSVATVWVPVLAFLSGYAWICGAILGALFYMVLARRQALAHRAAAAE
ncbi:NCS1 family nucleobase:cation symporter-1 [Pseudooceanicola sp. CBS1P-1]|uniref:NCS1 family nucleobase:cation symporter-1 n=1 Tax=Pseudooceanicola albus TaxID=2692189 RepID=A0A6L7G7F8_9RHOB|nr:MULTISPECIES: NCS1 family nucleobase:cation symporter-1 [Pseudooceanicola]MBT9384393.1 NCS1 family nucleobase:cation symporter-1 [Pseudooceanicola endophyticus]MXN19869.1 NCS1 family nucleobase:cation symporter-1 [Pseudooceanicola albus]